MGLLYLFPVDKQEVDHVESSDNNIVLKSYGLPYVFWIYAAAILLVLSLLGLAVYAPLHKLASFGTTIDKSIFTSVIILFISCPAAIFVFFFYEKQIHATQNSLTILHKVFFITFSKKSYPISKDTTFEVKHYLDSPNMARMSGQKDLRGFQNKGYFELHFIDENSKHQFLDRHSRKTDLEKIKKLLELN